MCRLIETIKISNRSVCNIDYHNRRLNHSRALLFGFSSEIDLKEHINLLDNISEGVYRCRVVCGEKVESVEILPYIIRPVKSLKLVIGTNIDYRHKFYDRAAIENLLEKREDYDDILIIKNGFITDTSICNVAFFDGRHWFTPESPLLRGTKRQQLIDEGVIFEKKIIKDELKNFEKIRAFNAMIEFGEVEIPVSEIR